MTPLARRLTGEDVAADDAARLADQIASTDVLTVGGVTVHISDRAHRVLADILEQLAAGRSLDMVPVNDTLSTSEAAELVGVTRPTLVKMLDDGLIEYEQPGVHRRVPRQALEAYLATRPGRRAAALADLAETFDSTVPDSPVTTR